MKRNLILAAAAFSMLLCSCTENPVEKAIVKSNVVPEITVLSDNNIIEVKATENSFTGSFKSNVENLISGTINASGMCNVTGSSYKFQNTNDNYTTDCIFCLMQDFANDIASWYDYESYGFIETPICFRSRGTKGTLAPAFDKTKDKPESYTYYVSGEITKIEDLDSKNLNFVNTATLAGYFKDWNYSPVTVYKADYICLTIEMADKTSISVNVYGKNRDNDIKNLKSYIKVGDKVEFPANAESAEKLAKKELKDILFCQVLRLN